MNKYSIAETYISLYSSKYYGFDFPTVTGNHKKNMEIDWYAQKPDLYIIDEYDDEKMERIINRLTSFSNLSFNPRARFIFILNHFTGNFFKVVSSFYITNVVLLNSSTLEFWRYFPYRTEGSNKESSILAKIGVCDGNHFIVDRDTLFDSATISNPWKISTMLTSYDYHEENQRQEIFKKFNAHCGMGVAISPDFTEFTMAYVVDLNAWFVPSPDLVPRWKYLGTIFSPMSRFTYLLNGLNYESPIDSFKKIEDNHFKIGAAESLVPLFNNSPVVRKYLQSHFVNCDSSSKCLNRTAFRGDLAVVKPARKVRFAERIYRNRETGHWLIKQLEPALFTRHIVAFFQRGHPVYPVFNRYLYYLVDAGIAEKIISKYDRKVTMDQPILSETNALSYEHILAPLSIWILGLTISAFVFVLECFRFGRRVQKITIDI
ncbi:hypothetical protein WA026_002749 [Henosepilachna vigintioctopunctata]|uniref:Ionotropic receptor n=1 Tax=Henosepilachna vigintioctopunctata TaxID=420089 RepID=A0AAW1U1A3_9CUCU